MTTKTCKGKGSRLLRLELGLLGLGEKSRSTWWALAVEVMGSSSAPAAAWIFCGQNFEKVRVESAKFGGACKGEGSQV